MSREKMLCLGWILSDWMNEKGEDDEIREQEI